MKNVLVTIIFLLSFLPALGQNSTVGGTVTDDSGSPMPYVAVMLEKDGKIIAGSISDDSGKFTVKGTAGQYTLSAEFIGYEKFARTISLVPGKNDAGTITLKESVQNIGEVTVVAKADAKKSSVEHTSINAEASMAGSKGSVLDILRTASSVHVTADGDISVRGNSNILVLLDGVPTTMTDLAALPSANVSSVDIITNPDARYDAEGTGGIINIVSKKQTATGLSGMAGANYGFNHYFNGNLALSCNRPKTSWRFNYNTKYEDDVINGYLHRRFVSNGNSTTQLIGSEKTTFNTNIGLGATFRIDKKNTLGTNVKLAIPRLNTVQVFHNTYQAGGTSREENRYSDISWNRENIDAGLNWRHIMTPDASEFTVAANVSKIWGHRPSYYYLEGQPVNKSVSGGSPLNSSVQTDFKFTGAHGVLETGAKVSFRRNAQNSDFYRYDAGVWAPDMTYSTDLIHQEYIPAAYVLFTSKAAGQFSYKAGLRAEYSIVTLHSDKDRLDTTDGDLFLAPTLSGTYRISESQSLSLAYSRRIGRPTYPQLNPYMSMIDASTFEQGNMNLKPEKSDNVDLAYSFKADGFSVFADMYLNHTSDYITQVSELTADILLMTYINAKSDVRSGLDLSLSVTPARWFDATLSANTFFVDTRGEFESTDIDNSGWSNNSNLLLNFLIGSGTSIQLQYFVSTPQYYPQFTTAFSHYMDIGLKHNFKTVTVTARLTDVFDTNRWEIHSDNRVFSLDNNSHGKSRMFWLGVSYNFNAFKQQKQEQKQELDRSRLNLGL